MHHVRCCTGILSSQNICNLHPEQQSRHCRGHRQDHQKLAAWQMAASTAAQPWHPCTTVQTFASTLQPEWCCGAGVRSQLTLCWLAKSSGPAVAGQPLKPPCSLSLLPIRLSNKS